MPFDFRDIELLGHRLIKEIKFKIWAKRRHKENKLIKV